MTESCLYLRIFILHRYGQLTSYFSFIILQWDYISQLKPISLSVQLYNYMVVFLKFVYKNCGN